MKWLGTHYAIIRGDNERVDSEEPLKLSGEAGLLQNFAARGVCWVFTRIKATTGQSPTTVTRFVPMSKQHALAVNNYAVCGQADIHRATVVR